jgi:hypothetical protein
MAWGIPPPNPDPLLEGKYARPRSFKDMAGGFVLGVVAFCADAGVRCACRQSRAIGLDNRV